MASGAGVGGSSGKGWGRGCDDTGADTAVNYCSGAGRPPTAADGEGRMGRPTTGVRVQAAVVEVQAKSLVGVGWKALERQVVAVEVVRNSE